MQVTWLGHSAFCIAFDAAKILIDPFLRGNPKFTLDFDAAIAGASHVVITHGHDDHIGDAAEIVQKTGAQVIANFEICMYLAERGVQNVNPGNTGGTLRGENFGVALTPALHSAAATVDGRLVALGGANGVVILPDRGAPIYHAGDTAIFSDMALIHELYRPRIGLVPVGDRFTMDGATAALAARRYFEFSDVIPMHYGSFPVIDPTPETFVTAMQGSGARVHTPAIGETLTF